MYTVFICGDQKGFATYSIATSINTLPTQGGLTEGMSGLKSKIFRIKYAKIENFTI